MIRKRDLFLLFLTTQYFCHRHYGIYFPLEGDTLQLLYFQLHHKLVAADHNPFQWDYASFMPFIGQNNPLIRGISFALSFSTLSDIAQSFWSHVLTSSLSLWGLACSLYVFLKHQGISSAGALIGAILVSSSGFHMIGVREFDHFYLLSFMFVPPVILCFQRLCTKQPHAISILLGSLFLGTSLLSATNLPMFFYLPLLFFLPFFSKREIPLGLIWARMFVTTALGCLLASITLIPGMAFLDQTNRGTLEFASNDELPFVEQLYSVFLRDWWIDRPFPYFHMDFYVGPAIFALAIAGLWFSLKNIRTQKDQTKRLHFYLLLCFLLGTLVLQYNSFPGFIQAPINFVYSKLLSIRHPHRFYLLCLIPIAYWCAIGFDNIKRLSTFLCVLSTSVLFTALCILKLAPNWNQLYADLQWACIGSLGSSCLVLFFLLCLKLSKSDRIVKTLSIVSVLLIYFTFLFAPIQLTPFSNIFVQFPKLLPRDFDKRLTITNYIGLGANYEQAIENIKKKLTTPSRLLRNPKTRKGRILRSHNLNVRNTDYFAPITKHRFAFTRLKDPAGSKYIEDLAAIRTDAIFDLYNICWLLHRRVSFETLKFQEQLVPRNSCLPEAFLVPQIKAFRSDAQVLQWMRQSNRKQFTEQIAINCETTNCQGLGLNDEPGSIDRASHPLRLLRASPGKFVFSSATSKDSFLFLSTVFRPDWRAKIGDLEIPVFRANHAFMALRLPAGNHQLEISLQPTLEIWSAAISWICYLVLAGLAMSHVKLPRFALVWESALSKLYGLTHRP